MLGGCNRPPPDDPVDAYRLFARAVVKGDEKAAFAALSAETQHRLVARANAVGEATGGKIQPKPADLAFGAPDGAARLTEVKLLSRSGDSAQVEATAADNTRTVTMVKESGGWKLDLREWLK